MKSDGESHSRMVVSLGKSHSRMVFFLDFLKPLDVIPVAIFISVKRFTCIHALLYVYKDFISFVRCNDKLNFTFKIKHAWPPPDNYEVYFHFKLTCLFLIFVVFV